MNIHKNALTWFNKEINPEMPDYAKINSFLEGLKAANLEPKLIREIQDFFLDLIDN